MKGLELSRAYYEEYGKPMIDTQLAQYKPYLAAGLVGEGSECLGFDDELSTDHDFGPAFCLWVPEELYAKAGTEMQRAYDSLPASYKGYTRITSAQAQPDVEFVVSEVSFIVNSPGFPTLRRTTWSGFVSRNAFWRR